MKKTSIAIAVSLLAAMPLAAKVTHLLPTPQKVEMRKGTYRGTKTRVLMVDSIPGAYDYPLAGYENEAYALDVTPRGITIRAVTPTGVLCARQTLAQMAEGMPRNTLECVSITDWPAFKLRGFMHDVGRSYISPDELIRQIEDFSKFKINTFHWHMTENQAWRFEVKKYPQLTAAESMTREPGKYYTQDDIRRVLEAAKRVGVQVIPEVDMPGHSAAFERAMGFEMQSPQGKAVLCDVLDEVAAVFPDAPYIHIGADEKKITDPTFLRTMVDKVHSLGRKVVVWNPIHGVKITADHGFDMTQMWGTAGKLVPGIPNIDCRYNYSNHFDVFADIVGIYKSNIYYADRGNPEIAGAITAPWNDRRLATERDITAQNNIYAATIATAERAWRGGGERYIEDGGTTLPVSGSEYENFADWERRFLFFKSHGLKHAAIPYVKQANTLWEVSVAAHPDSLSTAPTMLARGGGIYLRHTWGKTVPALYGKEGTPSPGVAAFARTRIFSPKDQTVGALIEFQNYSRSEKDLPPPAGAWDRKGSRVWLNGQEIPAPVWTNTATEVNNETLLGNENLTARPPVQLKLHKGWNDVYLHLPYVAAPGVRLNKWLFTFVITTPDGTEALPGIIYNPQGK